MRRPFVACPRVWSPIPPSGGVLVAAYRKRFIRSFVLAPPVRVRPAFAWITTCLVVVLISGSRLAGGPLPAVADALAKKAALAERQAVKAAEVKYGLDFAAEFENSPDVSAIPERGALTADRRVWPTAVLRRLAAAVGLPASGLGRRDLIDILDGARGRLHV